MSKKEKFIKQKKVILLSLAMAVLLATGFVWGHKSVQLAVDGQVTQVRTLKSDPAQILAQAGIVLGPKDEYRLSTEKIKDASVITVYRAVPVTVTYKGTSNTMMTGKPTVGELIADLGIAEDTTKIEPQVDTKITANLEIKVVDVSEKIIVREEEEPFEIIRQPDPAMEQGQEELVSYGESGEKQKKVKIYYEDGQAVREEVLEERVTVPAKPQVVRVGTRNTIETSRGAMRFRRTAHMEATAYLPSDGGGSGITATGLPARRGIAAVDPNVIPLGSRLYIPGYGMALAADTGGAVRGNIIDLCMEDYSEAMNFGRRSVKVYVLE